ALSGYVALLLGGSLTQPVRVILPGQPAAWNNGQKFHPDFLAYHTNSHSRCHRFMDWRNTNASGESSWSERTLLSDMLFENRIAPWQLCIDLCNETGKAGWFNIPARADDEYVDELGALLLERLHPLLIAHIENANELWNF